MERRAHGLVRPAGLSAPPDVERVDDAIGLLVPGTALGGWASLRHHGNEWFDGWGREGQRRVLVHCGPGTQLRRRDLVEPFRGLIHPWELTQVAGVTTSSIERAAFDEGRMARDLRSAVVAIDMTVSRVQDLPRTELAAVWRVVKSHFKVKGIVQVREALALVSDRSASPMESWTRLVARLDADLTNLSVNVPVFGPLGDLLGVADLFDPETGLVIETDGSGHREEEQHALDNVREEGFEHAGCVVMRVSPLDHRHRWDLVGRMHRAARAARRPRPHLWTTDPPEWWYGWSGAQRWL